ncbi:hypothetical protein NCU08542 [Neurospora crassa OR74A]|uniref:Uncharacterized protein n=1 Tax=Neurospora crassa (strain ATCC 24698 / 74-OR23-1A / CBS 708.71 / DSM 1257 / FGSC 987) TaxID=367110 RepID=Q7SBK8_NEUCR|nr:hypothetical protein NCU08542 [Neurospora crassa OR74A]EAA33788.3 hypothetical protein NCU08542 [Neurospora crassa OR74A]|eukprot:XP_963024.3 hypothetical protein NCU08542 [Neurospora crassa OR74A]
MYKLPNCHLSELDVDIDGASLEVQLHRDGAEKTNHTARKGKKPQANQSRYRRPTPCSVEHYRHEGDSGAGNDLKSSDDAPRGRSRSSTFTPTRSRAPTPHPHAHAHKSQKTKINMTVRFTGPLEPQSPVQKGETATAPPNRKSAMKREPESQKREEKAMGKEKDRAGESSEAHAAHHIRVAETPKDVQFCTLRRNTDRRSSVPSTRPKFAVSRSNTTSRPIIAPERPPSPLIPQAKKTSESHVPTAARDFLFDEQPEIFTGASHSALKSRHTSLTKDSFSPPSSTSYLQTKPKGNGTILPPTVKTERRPTCNEDSGNIKKCSSASPVHTREIKPTASPPKSPLPPSASFSSFHSAKSFWGDLYASSSCIAVVSGDSSKTPKPAALSRNRDGLPKTSMTSSSSSSPSYRPAKNDDKTVSGENGKINSKALSSNSLSRFHNHSKNTATGSTASSPSSFITAKSHLSNTNASDTDTDTPSSMAASSTSMVAEYIPSLQSELWNTITNFCRSDASSVSPEERYCDCDDCVWGEERNVAGCSTVARAGEGYCRARRV